MIVILVLGFVLLGFRSIYEAGKAYHEDRRDDVAWLMLEIVFCFTMPLGIIIGKVL